MFSIKAVLMAIVAVVCVTSLVYSDSYDSAWFSDYKKKVGKLEKIALEIEKMEERGEYNEYLDYLKKKYYISQSKVSAMSSEVKTRLDKISSESTKKRMKKQVVALKRRLSFIWFYSGVYPEVIDDDWKSLSRQYLKYMSKFYSKYYSALKGSESRLIEAKKYARTMKMVNRYRKREIEYLSKDDRKEAIEYHAEKMEKWNEKNERQLEKIEEKEKENIDVFKKIQQIIKIK